MANPLIPTFTSTADGYTVQLGLDATKLPGGYESYDFTLKFDPAKLNFVSAVYPGDFKIPNLNAVTGQLSVSGTNSTDKLPASTPLGTVNFKSLTSDPILVEVIKLNIGNVSYVSSGDSPIKISGDTFPPTLVANNPIAVGTVNSTQKQVTITYNEAVEKGTGTIELKTAAGGSVGNFPVATSAKLSIAGPVITIGPLDDLPSGTSYQIVIPAGAVKDRSGNPYAGGTLPFSTAATIDSLAPLLKTSDPVAGSTVSSSQKQVTLTFDEPVARGAGTIEFKTIAGASSGSFNVASSTDISLSGAVVVINLPPNLAGGTGYQMVIPAGTFKDNSGNAYAGSTLAFSTASTADITSPTLTQATPVSGTSGVATDAKIVLKFSEAVAFGQGAIQLRGPGSVLIQAFSNTSSGASIVGDTITLTPSVPLAKGSTYNLQIPSGTVLDKAGNSFSGLQNYQFITSALSSSDLRISLDRSVVDEGGTVNFLVRGTTSVSGSDLNFSLSGVSSRDIEGTPLSGTLQLDSTLSTELKVEIKSDNLTEGIETMVLNVAGITSTVTINDTSRASLVPQNLKGGVGAEVFPLSTGQDVVDGGSGLDTVIVNGAADDFEIARQGGKIFLSQKSSQNVDTLSDVERLEFTDRSVALDTDGGPAQTYRIYKAAFNREPDLVGMGYWISKMDQQMDMLELAQRFVDSAEFKAVYGAQPTNTAFISKLYQNVLNRSPDPIGLAWWLNEMNTNPTKSRAKVLADFSESEENKTALTGLMEDGLPFLPWQG